MKLCMVHFAQIALVSCFIDESIYNFTENILKYAFHTANCVYVIKDEGTKLEVIKTSLMRLNIPTVSINHEEAKLDEFHCHRYIVFSHNYTTIKSLFTGNMEQKILQFRAHSRMMIIYNGNYDFSLDKVFLMATNFYGLNLITVQCLGNFKANYWNASTTDFIVKVKNVRDNLLLASFNYKKGSRIYPDRFEWRNWTPNFTIGQSKINFGVSFFHCPPYVYYKPKLGIYDGVDYKILKFVARGWPLSFNPHQKNLTSSWKNVTDDLVQGVANLGLCSLWPIAITTKNLSMSIPYTQNCATFLVPKPHLAKHEDFIFQLNQTKLGLIMLIVSLITAGIFTLFAWIYHKFGKNNRYVSYAYSFIQIIRIMTSGPPCNFPPQNYTVFRVLLTSCCVTAILLSTGFSTGFATILTYPKFTKIINTLEDMFQENFSWGRAENDTTHIPKSNQFTSQLMEIYGGSCTIAKINEYIRKHANFALLVKSTPEKYISNIDTLNQYGLRHMKLLKECFEVDLAVLAFNKNSAFPKVFDEFVSKFLEFGFIQHWHKYILYKNGLLQHVENFYRSYPDFEPERSPLKTENLQGAFYLLFSGWCFAFLTLLFEIGCSRYSKNKQAKALKKFNLKKKRYLNRKQVLVFKI